MCAWGMVTCDNVVEGDVVDVLAAEDAKEFPDVVVNGIAAKDGTTGMMAGVAACCLIVVGVHDDADPDADSLKASGLDVIG